MIRRILFNRQFFLVLLGATALAGILIRFGVFDNFNKPVSKEFTANLLEVKNSSILVEGIFTITGDTVVAPKSQQVLHKAEVSIGSKTKIIRSVIYLPKTDKVFRISDLEKKIEEVSFDTLKSDFQNRRFDMTVIIKTDVNIYGETKFMANEITYIVPLLE